MQKTDEEKKKDQAVQIHVHVIHKQNKQEAQKVILYVCAYSILHKIKEESGKLNSLTCWS